MNRGHMAGWKDVYAFTLVQTLKSKAFMISFVLLIILLLVSMPVVDKLFSSATDDLDRPLPINKVYVYNHTGMDHLNFDRILLGKTGEHIIFEASQEDYRTVSDRITEHENDSIILNITDSEGIYLLAFARASQGPVSYESVALLSAKIVEHFQYLIHEQLGITDEQLMMIHAEVTTAVITYNAAGQPVVREDTSISHVEYWFVYGLMVAIMMVNILASTKIATSIVTEKSTRVIEYLLISVRPLALMVGKILAMLTAVMIQVISYIIVLYVSNTLSTVIAGGRESTLSQHLPADIFANLSMGNILFCLVLVVLGMFFYAALAGLIGATVSRVEEIGEGLTVFTLISLVGVYIGLGAANILTGPGVNGFVIFALLFPLSSPFLLPGAILVGKASPLLVAAAIVLQIALIFMLLRFVARVYEAVILHFGSKMKITELFKLSKTMSREEAL